VHSGAFRQDLYYRLAVVPVRLPALRERKEDIPDLCKSLCQRIAEEMKVPSKVMTPAALEKLSTYSFPGNIRELRNILERALILGRSVNIEPENLYLPSTGASESRGGNDLVSSIVNLVPNQVNLRELLTNFERTLIARSLELSHGVQAEAARKLGLSRSDLGYKVGRYGLSGVAETASMNDDPQKASSLDRA